MYSEFFPWNNSDILWDFFLRNFSYGQNFKLLRKDSDPSYLRVGLLHFCTPGHTPERHRKKVEKKERE
jgi:hypothetical protein